jgi:hypothetical protein
VIALGSGTALLAAVQQAARLFQIDRLAGTCAVTAEQGCRLLDVRATVAAIHRLDSRSEALLVAQYLLLLAGGAAWLAWQHRSQRLVRDRLAAPELRFTPGWAVGWWFVPFANLWVPAVTTAELWRASGGDASGERWQRRRIPGFLRWWWGLVVASAVLGVIAHGQSDPAEVTFSHVRANAVALTLGSAALAAAGVLSIAVLWSAQRRLERARPYPEDAGLASGATPVAARGASDDAPSPRRRGAVVAGVVVVVAAAAATGVFLVTTSPSIRLFEAPAPGGPSPVATSLTPSDWRAYGSPADGFLMSAPPDWREADDGSPALLRLAPADGTDATCLVLRHPPSAGMALEDVVAELLSQIHDPAIYHLRGEVEVRALALPAGPAEGFRFATVREGQQRGYVQFVLVNERAGWLVGCDAPSDAVEHLAPLFERMISTFRFTG